MNLRPEGAPDDHHARPRRLPQQILAAHRDRERQAVDAADEQQGERGADERRHPRRLQARIFLGDEARAQQAVVGEAVEAHGHRGQRSAAGRGLEQYLAADAPVRAIIAAAHPLPARLAVGIGEPHRKPVEAREMHHQCGAVAILGTIADIGPQPQAAVAIPRRLAAARKAQRGQRVVGCGQRSDRVAERRIDVQRRRRSGHGPKRGSKPQQNKRPRRPSPSAIFLRPDHALPFRPQYLGKA